MSHFLSSSGGSRHTHNTWRGPDKLLAEKVLPPCKKVAYLEEVDVDAQIKEQVDKTNLPDPAKLEEILKRGKYAKFKNDAGFVPRFTHCIPGEMPPGQHQYSLNPKIKKELDQTINELEELEIIRKVRNPPTNVPVKGVPNSDGTIQLVLDLSELNRRSSSSDARYSINPSRTMRVLPQHKYKTSLDISNGFWSIPIDQQSQLKTCFTWGADSYCWLSLPMGYKNSTNVFQTAVVKTLEGLPVEVYQGALYFTHEDPDEHLRCLDDVLKKLSRAGFKVGLKKCEIAREALVYLGFKISPLGKEITDSYKQKIRDFPDPKCVTDLERFLGIVGFVSDHVPHMSEKASPLHKLKGQLRRKYAPEHIKLSSEDLADYRALKTHVIEAAQHLEKRKMETPLEAHLEINNIGGGVETKNVGSKQPTLFSSNTWSPTEAKYSDEEKYLCLAYGFLPALKEVAGEQQVIFYTPLPSLKEATRQTTTGANAMMSRWSKWQMMRVDPQVDFQQEEQNSILGVEPRVHFSADIAGPFPTRTKAGCRFVLIIADNGSSYKQAWPVRSPNGWTLASRMGVHLGECPETRSMTMDDVTNFKSKCVNEVLTAFSVQQIWSEPYARHANGVVQAATDWISENAPSSWDEPLQLTQLNSFLNQLK